MNSHCASPEPLESRIAPALAFALDANNTLISFDLSEPDEILTSLSISGLLGGDTLLGMDFRPADGNLYAIGSGQRLYVIDPGSGEADLIATLTADPADATDPFTGLTGSFFGIDINPVVDRMRVVSDSGENLRINLATGLVITDGALAFGAGDANFGEAPAITGAAYTNAYVGATGTTLYALDTTQNALVLINPPNNGALLTIGALGVDPSASASFEIAPNSTDAFAIMTVSSVTGLYRLNLGSGDATFVGAIGSGTVGTRGFVILPGDLTLLNDRTATYVDADGDRVTVKVSTGELSANDFRLIARGPEGAQLAALNLSDDGGEFAGASVTIQAAKPGKGGSGDGFVNVGEILADVDLNKVKVDGDLGRIRAGDNNFDNNKGVGLSSLQVHSLGAFGTDTGGESIFSSVVGSAKKVRVQTDVGGSFAVTGLEAGDIGSVRIGGSLAGGDESSSGKITATGEIQSVKIGGDVRGGTGNDSGRISAGGSIGSLIVGGSLLGGDDLGGTLEAQVQSGGDIGRVKIAHDVVGGDADRSGSIIALGDLGKVQIGGSLQGGSGDFSGQIGAEGDIRSVQIRSDVVGGAGRFSGAVHSDSGTIAKLKIGGALIGGSGHFGPVASELAGRIVDEVSAQVFARAGINKLQIGEGIVGGAGIRTGTVESRGPIGKADIGGSVIGGSGFFSGVLVADGFNKVRIDGSLDGGASSGGGALRSAGDLRSLTITGSLLGGSEPDSGRISVEGDLRKLTIGGDVSSAPAGRSDSRSILAGSLGKVSIGGSLTSSPSPSGDTVAIQSLTTIDQMKIKGDVRGTEGSAVVIMAGTTPDDARRSTTIGKVEIGGSASHLNLLAGFSSTDTLLTGVAEIGRVRIGGDFIASNIVAGVDAGADGFWGTADDQAGAQTSSAIASVIIKGQAAGTSGVGDHFGIVAEAIGKVQAGGLKLEIPQSVTEPPKTIGWSEDLTIRVDV